MGVRNIVKFATSLLVTMAFAVDVGGMFHDLVLILFFDFLDFQLLIVRRVEMQKMGDLLDIVAQPDIRCTP